jgi:hypothetical protein
MMTVNRKRSVWLATVGMGQQATRMGKGMGKWFGVWTPAQSKNPTSTFPPLPLLTTPRAPKKNAAAASPCPRCGRSNGACGRGRRFLAPRRCLGLRRPHRWGLALLPRGGAHRGQHDLLDGVLLGDHGLARGPAHRLRRECRRLRREPQPRRPPGRLPGHALWRGHLRQQQLLGEHALFRAAARHVRVDPPRPPVLPKPPDVPRDGCRGLHAGRRDGRRDERDRGPPLRARRGGSSRSPPRWRTGTRRPTRPASRSRPSSSTAPSPTPPCGPWSRGPSSATSS